MTLSRRTLLVAAAGSLASAAQAADDAISAAILAITRAQPLSLDSLQIMGETGARPLSGERGRLVVLNVWASWCLPCRREMPSLSRLASHFMDKPLTVLPVSMDRSGVDAVRSFYAETGISNLPLLAGDIANLQAVTGQSALPCTFLLDADGQMRWTVTGEAQWDDGDTIAWISSLLPV